MQKSLIEIVEIGKLPGYPMFSNFGMVYKDRKFVCFVMKFSSLFLE